MSDRLKPGIAAFFDKPTNTVSYLVWGERTRRAPLLLMLSIQLNIRAGILPAAEGNGMPYLKIPMRFSPAPT